MAARRRCTHLRRRRLEVRQEGRQHAQGGPAHRPPVIGEGNNARYTIVGFAGVIITEAVLVGSQNTKHITIQPEFVIDGTAIGGGSITTSKYVYRGVYLTR